MRAAALLLALAAACDRGPFTQPLTLGGRTYSAAELDRGFHLYRQGCRPCHGDLGDGHGASAPGLWPPPRDLTQAIYKFARVPAPGLPPDRELARVLRGGLAGTGMLAWTMPDDDLDALLGYVKSLAPRWRTEVPGEAVVAPVDPIEALAEDARRAVRERGAVLYHGKAMCSSCHPAYVDRPRLYEIAQAMGLPTGAYTPELYGTRVKDSELCWHWRAAPGGDCTEPVRTIPPDFLHDPLRAVDLAQARRELFATLAAGIPGAGMPPWRGALADDELWALAEYVRSLVALRGTAAGDDLRAHLRSDENVGWQAPR